MVSVIQDTIVLEEQSSQILLMLMEKLVMFAKSEDFVSMDQNKFKVVLQVLITLILKVKRNKIVLLAELDLTAQVVILEMFQVLVRQVTTVL